MSFFYTAIEQIEDERREDIQFQAIAVRGAKYEDFKEFLEMFDKKKEISEQDLHKSNLAMLNKKL